MWKLIKKQQPNHIRNKYYELLQEKWVRQMSNLTAGLTSSTIKFVLIVFVLLASSFFTATIYCSFQEETPKELTIGSISIMNISSTQGENRRHRFQKTDDFKSGRTVKFRKYMDSTWQSPIDVKMYDSINYFKPGLIDSLFRNDDYKKINIKK